MRIRPQNDPCAVLLTHNHLRVLKPSGETVSAVPVALDTRKFFFQFAMLPSNGHFVLRAVPLPGESAANPQQIFEYAADGKLAAYEDCSACGRCFHDCPATDCHPGRCLAAHSVAAIHSWKPRFRIRKPIADNAGRCSSGRCSYPACCAAPARCFFRRKFGFGMGKTLAWIVTNLLLGPAGVVLMLGLNDWPARGLCCLRQEPATRQARMHLLRRRAAAPRARWPRNLRAGGRLSGGWLIRA